MKKIIMFILFCLSFFWFMCASVPLKKDNIKTKLTAIAIIIHDRTPTEIDSIKAEIKSIAKKYHIDIKKYVWNIPLDSLVENAKYIK